MSLRFSRSEAHPAKPQHRQSSLYDAIPWPSNPRLRTGTTLAHAHYVKWWQCSADFNHSEYSSISGSSLSSTKTTKRWGCPTWETWLTKKKRRKVECPTPRGLRSWLLPTRASRDGTNHWRGLPLHGLWKKPPCIRPSAWAFMAPHLWEFNVLRQVPKKPTVGVVGANQTLRTSASHQLDVEPTEWEKNASAESGATGDGRAI